MGLSFQTAYIPIAGTAKQLFLLYTFQYDISCCLSLTALAKITNHQHQKCYPFPSFFFMANPFGAYSLAFNYFILQA